MTNHKHEATIVADRILARNIEFVCTYAEDIAIRKVIARNKFSGDNFSEDELCERLRGISHWCKDLTMRQLRDQIDQLKYEIDISERTQLEFEMMDLLWQLDTLRFGEASR